MKTRWRSIHWLKILTSLTSSLIILSGCSSASQTPTAPPALEPATAPPAPSLHTPQRAMTTSPMPTDLPHSYYDLSIALTATTTEAKVGDMITVTIMVTNTGKLCANKTYCELRGWSKDETTPHDYLDAPLFEPAYPGIINFDWAKSNCPGTFVTCVFVLQAVRPGTVVLKGGFGGKVHFSMYEQDVGKEPKPLTLYIGPAQ